MDDSVEYIRCRNCGTWIASTEVYREHFCCLPCSIQYVRCIVCGKYFPQGEGFTDTTCSSECGEHATIDITLFEGEELVTEIDET